MEEGTKTKKTIFVGGIGDDVDESALIETFSTFGDIIEVQLPTAQTHQTQANPNDPRKHRGFGFVTFSSAGDAQDAIDNMDMNELRGRVLKVNIARPTKAQPQLQGNRAIWESEEWLKEHAKPLSQSGGIQARRTAQSPDPQPPEDQDDDAMET